VADEAGVYVRISDDREGAGLGVARQEDDCRGLAKRLGLAVGEVYVDNDLSASAGRRRPAYQRLLADVRAGRWRAVLVWHTDRLHRSPAELEEWIDAADRGGCVVQTVKAGELDLSTPSGRMVARMLGAAARYEVEHKADRQRRKAAELALSGAWSGGGHRPYGYRKVAYLDDRHRSRTRLEIDPVEADVIREAADRIAAGEPLRALTRDLNSRGVPTSTGGLWSAQTIRRMLCAGLLSGQREHQPRSRAETRRDVVGPIVASGSWPAILSAEQTQVLRGILLDPARRLTPRTPRKCLLTGVLRCHGCGRGLAGRPREDHVMRYVCQRLETGVGCGRTYVLADPADEYVSALVLAAFDGSGLATHMARGAPSPGGDDLRAAIAGAQQQLVRLGADYDDGLISRTEWLARRGRIEDKAREAQRRLLGSETARRVAAVSRSGPLRERWPAMTTDQRRAVITAVIDSIVVGPGRRGYNRFDPSRFGDPVWRA
jgi:DNA invertase Pin-like site-specific DNA recombinase